MRMQILAARRASKSELRILRPILKHLPQGVWLEGSRLRAGVEDEIDG